MLNSFLKQKKTTTGTETISAKKDKVKVRCFLKNNQMKQL